MKSFGINLVCPFLMLFSIVLSDMLSNFTMLGNLGRLS